MHTSSKHTYRGLVLLALMVFGIACWQASNWSDSAVHAAAVRASRTALDEAAAKFQADPGSVNATLLNEARTAFLNAVAADPSYAKANPHPTIAPSAMVQIQALRGLKENLTKVQKKIGSRLLIVLKRRQGGLPAGLESLRTSVETTNGGNNAVVDITVTSRIAGLKALDHYNFVIRSAVGKTIRAEVPFDKLEEIAGLSQVISIREPMKRYTSSVGPFHPASSLPLMAGFSDRATRVGGQLLAAIQKVSGPRPPALPSAINVSEGDKTHRAFDGRNTFGVNGAGVKVGVISDGVNSLASLQASGDLPAGVTVLPGQAGSGDEGSAMLEIVHDLAPGAQLFFATADPTQAQFAQNIRDLRTAGCDIIVDDVIYLDESPVHDGQPNGLNSTMGLIEQAVNDVTALGALYFSSAGNEGNVTDLTSGTWEGNFVPSAAPDPGALAGANLHNFGDGGNSILVEFGGGNPPLLHWADFLDNAANDYDLYDMDGALTTIFDASTDVQDGTGGDDQPIEFIGGGTFSGERLLIDKFADDGNPANGTTEFLSLRVFRGELDDSLATTGSTHGHSHAANAFSVAATPAAASFDGITPDGPYPGPFTGANEIEGFSSDGPRRILFDANNMAITPGNVTSTGGVLRQKPDITAADGVSCAAPGFSTFYGTSAAAPHAAAIAALLKSANGSLTPAQIRTALTSSAIDIHAAGTDRNSGAGIVMAFEALQFIGATPVAFLESAGATLVTESCIPANGVLDPMELVTVSLCVQNTGGANTTANLAGTLQATGGVTNIQAPNPQNYGIVVAGGPAICREFTFTVANVACGTPITASVQFQDGATDLGTVTYTFSTGTNGAPATFSYTGPAVPIPDSPGENVGGTPAVASLNVAGLTGNIGEVVLQIDGTSCSTAVGSTTVGIDHTFVNDLIIRLRSPSGTVVDVISRIDEGGNNFCQTMLDDNSAGASIQSATTAPFTGSFKPANPLSTFIGEPGNGTWQLEAQDFFIGDTGNIRAFSLIIKPRTCATTCVTCTGITCPANITQPNDTNQCGAVVTYPAPTPNGTCGTITCSPASGSFFPIGTTTVNCQASPNPDAATGISSGNVGATCTFTVTVTDDQPPTITCPANITKPNDPNQCGAVVTYPPPVVTDNCPGTFTATCVPASGSFFPVGTTTVTCQVDGFGGGMKPSGGKASPGPLGPQPGCSTITESTSQAITNLNSVSCNNGVGHTDNSYWRAFTLSSFGISGAWDVQSVDIGVELASAGGGAPSVGGKRSISKNSSHGSKGGKAPTATQPITVRLWTSSSAFPTGYPGSLTMIGQTDTTVADQSDTIINIPVTGTAPAGSQLVVEIFTPDGEAAGNFFFIGSNAAAETGPSYLSAAACGITTPTTTAAIGFPDMHIVMNVHGCDQAVGNGPTCTFTVKVNDTQPPVITCPANIFIAAAASCPPATSRTVNYTVTATDNCPGVTVACVPPSGSIFPVGTTTVTCTATDASGNTASCSFTVRVFTACLQDETNPGNVVLLDALTGGYRFCCNGVLQATGTGVLTIRGCVGSITDQKGDRKVTIGFDFAASKGTASLFLAGSTNPICKIIDQNLANDSCACPSAPPDASLK